MERGDKMQRNKYFPKIFQKGRIGNVEIKNRLVRNSMGTYLGNPDGSVSDDQVKAYAQAADGGVGLIFMDNATPVPMTSCGLRADSDEFIPGLSKLADAIKMHGAVAGMQLAHPGRDAGFVGSADVVAASAVTYEQWYEHGAKLPRPLTIDEIHDIEDKFGDAARRCKQAGFQILEIHAAAGCLPTNFLSPHDNQRTDIYGGSLHNRMRFLLETLRNMKQKCGESFPIGVKLSTEDFEPAGIRLNETIEVAKALEKAGCSHINLIAGTHATSDREFLMKNGFNNEECKAIADAVNIPCFVGHNIFTPAEAEKALEDGDGEFVSLGRSQLADPMWAKKAEEGHPEDIVPCINCLVGCLDNGLLSNNVIHCAVNPTLYRFNEHSNEKAAITKNVAVIGAGPGGCEAALAAAKRGHKVTLYEKRAFGGAMIEAAVPDNKKNIARLTEYYRQHIENNDNITVINEEATFEKVANRNYDACVVAIGGKPREIEIKNTNDTNFISAMDYLNGAKKVTGQKVTVIGGGITAAETALELKKDGKDVTVVVRSHFLKQQATSSCSRAYAYAVAKEEIKVVEGLVPQTLDNNELVFTDYRGNKQSIATDTIVSAAGYEPQTDLYDQLYEDTDMQVFNIGDSKSVRQIYDAVHEGYIAAQQI